MNPVSSRLSKILGLLVISGTCLAGTPPGTPGESRVRQLNGAKENPTAKAPVWGGMEARSEISLGTTLVDVSGSRERFLTESFIRPGINLQEFLLDLRPTEGSPTPFNFATVTASGFGDSQPYQRFDGRLTKRKSYDFRSEFRKFNYFFDLPAFTEGLHPENSVVRSSSHKLRLFPDRPASIDLGYRRNQQYGTAFYTVNLPVDTFQISQPRRLSSDEYSAGTTLRSGSLSLTLSQSFIKFKDDSQISPNPLRPEGVGDNRLEGGQRDTPTRISTPVSHIIGRYRPASRWDLVGRYRYSRSNLRMRRFDEFLNSLGPARTPVGQIISSSGTGRKPTHTADVSQTFQVNDRVSLHQQSHYQSYSISGFIDTVGILRFFSDQNAPPNDVPVDQHGGLITEYEFMRHRLDVDVDLTDSLSLLGGYRYSERKLGFSSYQGPSLEAPAAPLPQVRIQHTGIGGISWSPIHELSFRGEVEKGTASSAFYRIEPTSFVRYKFRAEARPGRQMILSANATLTENKNDTAGANHGFRDRQIGAQVSYVPSARLVVTGGYQFMQIHSNTDILFFTLFQLTQGRSLYRSNLHFGHADLLFPVGSRLRLHLGYQLIRDRGLSFPLLRDMPGSGLSLRLFRGLHWEAEWRHISYNEREQSNQDYRANILTTGVKWVY